MNKQNRKPTKYDLVLGGNNPPPIDGVVLGGIEGVEKRLSSKNFEAKLAAVTEALKYGDKGIELIIDTLEDSSEEFQYAAAKILKQQESLDAKQALFDYDPYLFFTTLKDWNHVIYNPEVGISDPINNAYIVRLDSFIRESRVAQWNGGERVVRQTFYKVDTFKALLATPQAKEITALSCQINDWNDRYENREFGIFLEAICDAAQQLPNLKALFIGDGDPEDNMFRKSYLDVFDITPILEAYPNLEVLQVCGKFSDYPFECEGLKHDCLKTLIIETADLSDYNLEEICCLDLPELEYLEIWLGRRMRRNEVDSLSSILNYNSFPNLKYLGLKSGEDSDLVAQAIIDSPILKHLSVLDLSMGTLTDAGVEPLLNCPEIEQLDTLDISNNAVSEEAIGFLSEIIYNLIADNQANTPYDSYRYSTLHE
ncbi:hypothetical protein [Crocosphaera chwakensis]|uniref:Leucine rich repeat variant n=1 Tax=Crocosphaera chwakensis CCY0110 TaxID=391612 RepID=A3ITD2_9CHRO|nr:hypothetical protein [Crocosphaera chwakensis]EAZ90317.1 hypothetical protein CY0110_04311 [Crocosphaera chwakensis CCY0110]